MKQDSIESIAKLYLAMIFQYQDYSDLDRVDKTIITSEEIFNELKNWTNE